MKNRYSFRGKKVRDGEWVVGNLLYPDSINEFFVIPVRHPYIDPYMFIVKPQTIGQCTGLKDMHGNLIFEGDILKLHGEGAKKFSEVHRIFWFKDRWALRAYKAGDSVRRVSWVIDKGKNTEIIGNIHDNPELLEGKPCETQTGTEVL